MEAKIVESTGTATTRRIDDSTVENPVEMAMSNAVIAIYKDADDIWHRNDLDENKKREMITDLLNDENVRKRMLSERAKARAAIRLIK